jgi:hypothetical protein
MRLAGLAATVALCAVSAAMARPAAEDGGNPYTAIPERNVFALKPPPPPATVEPPKPPTIKLTLRGIMTIFGKKQAIFDAPPTPAPPPKPGQPPDPPKQHSYMLAEGQREEDITVLRIDELARTVKVDNAGDIETLEFATNANKTASAPAAAPSAPNPFQGNPGMPGAPRTIPRPLRIPVPGAAGAPGGFGSSVGNAGTAGAAQPAGSVNTGYGGAGFASYQNAQQAAADQQQSAAPTEQSVAQTVLTAEVNATRNAQLRAAGAKIPPIPHHPLARGLYGQDAAPSTPAPDPAPQQQAPMPLPGMPQPLPQ